MKARGFESEVPQFELMRPDVAEYVRGCSSWVGRDLDSRWKFAIKVSKVFSVAPHLIYDLLIKEQAK